MSYQATVIPVMIASPGDVLDERRSVREILYTWNDVNSRDVNAILTPVSWETHSAPDLSARPQELINQRVLKECDLLVGIFWTRLGTPTGKAKSGTVEEIQEHLSAGKPAMIYFSARPVVLDSVVQSEYDEVREFKKWCQSQGLVKEYNDLDDFEKQFRLHLPLNLRDNPYLRKLLERSVGDKIYPPTVIQEVPGASLSAEALELLKEGAASKDGLIYRHESMSGFHIQANRKVFGANPDPRVSSRWDHALKQLVERGLVESVGANGVIFRVTAPGFELVDSQLSG